MTLAKFLNFSITAYFTEGQSTAIVGRVGCGKSSLLNALLGNIDPHNGGTHQLTLILARPETSSIFPRRAFRRLDFPQPTRPTMAVD